LLKRFKVPDELEGVQRGQGSLRGERDLDALFQELDSLTCGEGEDSGQDMDSLSIGSTPKPSLRPFFTNSKGMLNETLSGKNEPKKLCIQQMNNVYEMCTQRNKREKIIN
jgi:phosphofurin acidic cluster sorting protein 2